MENKLLKFNLKIKIKEIRLKVTEEVINTIKYID